MEWQDRLRALAARLRVTRPVALLESCLAETPVLIGFLRPAILIPAGLLAGLAPDQLEAILLHELAHIRRHDYAVNVMQSLVEGLLFYHPAVWWLSNAVRAERENCCDDAVVALRGDAVSYAAALAALEERRSASQPALAATGGNLMNRIRRLLEPNRKRPAAGPALAAILLLAPHRGRSIRLAIPAARAARAPSASRPLLSAPPPVVVPAPRQEVSPGARPARRRRTGSGSTKTPSTSSPRTKAEAFKKLATDEERDHFIEQFWLRRDPTPGTPENEFKEEHYRRIAYANQHFAESAAGWNRPRFRRSLRNDPRR